MKTEGGAPLSMGSLLNATLVKYRHIHTHVAQVSQIQFGFGDGPEFRLQLTAVAVVSRGPQAAARTGRRTRTSRLTSSIPKVRAGAAARA